MSERDSARGQNGRDHTDGDDPLRMIQDRVYNRPGDEAYIARMVHMLRVDPLGDFPNGTVRTQERVDTEAIERVVGEGNPNSQ